MSILLHSFIKSTPRYLAPVMKMGFHGDSDGKESACNAGNLGSIPGSGRSPGEGNGYPLQYSCLQNPMGRGACVTDSLGSQRVRQSWATSTFTFHFQALSLFAAASWTANIHPPNSSHTNQPCWPWTSGLKLGNLNSWLGWITAWVWEAETERHVHTHTEYLICLATECLKSTCAWYRE